MNITVIRPPPFEPVTLLEVYRHLRLDPDHEGSPSETSHPDDAMLSGFIATAREYVETATRRALVQQTLRLSCAGFPRACFAGYWPTYSNVGTVVDRIILRRPPIIAVESVSYFDADNTLRTVARSDYYVTDDAAPEVRFASSFSAPSTYARPDAVRVEYTAGYAPEGSPATTQEDYAGGVPETFKSAILLGVQLLYDNLAPADREAVELMRESLLQTKRVQHV